MCHHRVRQTSETINCSKAYYSSSQISYNLQMLTSVICKISYTKFHHNWIISVERNSFTYPSKVWLNCVDFQTGNIQNTTWTKFYPEQKIYKIYPKFNSNMPSNVPLSQDFQLLRSIKGVSETSQEIWNVRGEIHLCPEIRHDCHRTNFHKISATQQVL